ncbi:MAG: DUF4399 domain-containing protein [Pseudomonadales bacterium]
MKTKFASIGAALLLVASLVRAEDAPTLVSASPAGAELYFIAPLDGDTVPATFTVRFGLRGMGVAPAGADLPNTGHHHLLIDHEGEISLTTPLPKSDQVQHFGGGQTETTVTLSPGKHRLQLVLGNYLHIPHDPPVMSKEITVTVQAAD